MSAKTTGIDWNNCTYKNSSDCEQIRERAATLRDASKSVPVRYRTVAAHYAFKNKKKEDAHAYMHSAGRALFDFLNENCIALLNIDSARTYIGQHNHETPLCHRAMVETGMTDSCRYLQTFGYGEQDNSGLCSLSNTMALGPLGGTHGNAESAPHVIRALRDNGYFALMAQNTALAHAQGDALGMGGLGLIAHVLRWDREHWRWVCDLNFHVLMLQCLDLAFDPRSFMMPKHFVPWVAQGLSFVVPSISRIEDVRRMRELRDAGDMYGVAMRVWLRMDDSLKECWQRSLAMCSESISVAGIAGSAKELALLKFALNTKYERAYPDRLEDSFECIIKLMDHRPFFEEICRTHLLGPYVCRWLPRLDPMMQMTRQALHPLRDYLQFFAPGDKSAIETVVKSKVIEGLARFFACNPCGEETQLDATEIFCHIMERAPEYAKDICVACGRHLIEMAILPDLNDQNVTYMSLLLAGHVILGHQLEDPEGMGPRWLLFESARKHKQAKMLTATFAAMTSLFLNPKQRRDVQQDKLLKNRQWLATVLKDLAKKQSPNETCCVHGVGLVDVMYTDCDAHDATWEDYATFVVKVGQLFSERSRDAAEVVTTAIYNYSRNSVIAKAMVRAGALPVLHKIKEKYSRDPDLPLFADVATKNLRS